MAALLAGLGLAAPAAGRPTARVAVGPARIVLTTSGGARVIVDRNPLRLQFLDARGRTVLREVATDRRPLRIASTTQVEFGAISAPPPTAYAPLSFLVGAAGLSQEPSDQWEGDLASTTERGTLYSAQRVIAVSRRGTAITLMLVTNDPSGRRLRLTLAPGAEPDAIDVALTPTSARGVAAMADSFGSPPGEAFHGFGGRHDGVDQHGQDFVNWLDQENFSSASAGALSGTASGAKPFLYPNGPQAAYYVQSSFVSSAGYGFLLTDDALSRWRLDSDRADAWQTEVDQAALHYTVVPAAAVTALSQLTAITGRQPVPPGWAVGSLWDREVKLTSDGPTPYALQVQDDINHFRADHVHIDGYRLEGWAQLPGPVLAHLMAELKGLGIHPLVYFRAFVGLDTTGTDDPALYGYAIAHHYVATRANGAPYTFTSNFNQPAAMIDFTNPAAVRWWQGRITHALDLGADGFMQDFGEQVLADMHFHDGSTGATMHNRLPILYDRATRQAITGYLRHHPHRQIFFFTRAGYSGTPGDAAYENANFPGDETTDYSPAAGLASLGPDMLNRAIGGAYGYTTDIGGYYDLGPYAATSRELFLRWAEWAALSPLFRLHGSLLAGVHTPWSYGAATVSAYRGLIALHLAARPLILALWREADRTGMPITRPLWLVDSDPRAADNDQEWLLGPDVLVAPVVTPGATTRATTFPLGCWRQAGAGPVYHGPSTRSVAAPLGRLPYFFRCGTRPFRPPA